jgi:class 3 adenylate cyclase
MIKFVKDLNFQQQGLGNDSWYIRIGVHIRPLIAGEATHQFNIWGDTVNMASRMESSGEQMIVHFSKDTKMQVPESLKFLKRENVSVKDKGLLSTDVLEN